MDFNGARLRLARVFRGLTQRDLAQEIAASEATVWQLERGRTPTETLLEALGLVLGFEPEFFFEPLGDEFTEGDCNFRRRLTASERLLKRVLARGTLFGAAIRYLSQALTLPKYNVPDVAVTTPEDIERAAEQCRSAWSLGLGSPVVHMGRVLEHAGVVVTRLDEASRLDAFSRRGRDGGVSVVVLNTAKGSTSRTRFDMAHELGHLVMHAKQAIALADREKQADRFASAFLLPRRGFVRDFWAGGKVDWANVIALKARWKVSIQAMIYRAYDLDLIDAVEFRRAYKAISVRGWRKHEPEEPPAEQPELFGNAMKLLWEKKRLGVSDVARALHWSARTFEDVTGVTPERGVKEGVLELVPIVKRFGGRHQRR